MNLTSKSRSIASITAISSLEQIEDIGALWDEDERDRRPEVRRRRAEKPAPLTPAAVRC